GMKSLEIKNKFDEIVQFAGVERFIETPVKRYSSGMYVRLAFAVAAHLDPEILIIDEVLAVGDVDFQRKCIGKIQDVSRNEGRTVLFVSHNFGAVESLCNKGLHLENGTIAYHGNVKDAIHSFHQSYNIGNKTSLDERKDRKGSGKCKFTSIELLDQDLNPILYALSGQNIVLRIGIDNQSQEILNKNFQIDVGINSRLGEPLVWLSTSLMENFLSIENGKSFVELTILDCSLLPGEYQVTLFCKSTGEIMDWVEEAFILEVETGDYYKNGRFPSIKFGNFMIRHYFRN
ncbi:MAG: Wzt carbohydrate-binding domain-containing protein, partial [Cytophagales bacterium]|nr:Wzt carbohydrate-binding domain-containing protein [Cytophagales bacterium]